MTYSMGDMGTVTTWGQRNGYDQWRLRTPNGRCIEFLAEHDVPFEELVNLCYAVRTARDVDG